MTARAKRLRAAGAVAVFLCSLAVAITFQPRTMPMVLVAGGIFLCGVFWWAVRDQREVKSKRPTFVDELEIDEHHLRYSAFSDRAEVMAWSDVVRVEYYFGEPDVPDPLVGLAPINEWRLYGSGRPLSVPELQDHSTRLADWCGRKLPGFRHALLEEALSSKEFHAWLLWKRDR